MRGPDHSRKENLWEVNDEAAATSLHSAVHTSDPQTLRELNSISITELLESDSRPTFIIDLGAHVADGPNSDSLAPVFCNLSLRLYDDLMDIISGDRSINKSNTAETTYLDFVRWVTSVSKYDDSMDIFPLSFLYHGMLWTGSTVRKRWRLVSGNKCYKTACVASGDLSLGLPSETSTGSFKTQLSDLFSSKRNLGHVDLVPGVDIPIHRTASTSSRSKKPSAELKPALKSPSNRGLSDSDLHVPAWTSLDSKSSPSVVMLHPLSGVTDWTVDHITGTLSSHVLFARSIDWRSTSLGAMSTWSRELRQLVNMLMADPHPAAMFWGNDMTVIYNEPYRDIVAGHKHPDLMGTGFRGPFSEIWDDVGPIFNECARTGKSTAMANQMLPIQRHGFLEETYFSWSCIPLFGGTDRVQGFYNSPYETTHQCIGDRRLSTLHKLGELAAQARTVKEFWGRVIEGLDDNLLDVPFALLYSVAELDDGDCSSNSSSGSSIPVKSCIYEGGLGVRVGHQAAPMQLDLKRSREGFIPSFREAMRTREPTKIQTMDGTLREALIEGIEWRGYGEPCREAVIFPLRPTTGESVLGFLVMGVSPRRPYDDHYKSFTAMLNRQLATSLASIILFEEEIRRGRTAAEAAAIEHEHLTEELAVQTSRLQRMTALSPVGLFYISPGGFLLEANDCWYEMTGHLSDKSNAHSWLEVILEEDRPIFEEAWSKLTVDMVPWSGEARLRNPWVDPVTGESHEHWILCSAHPECTWDGAVRSIMGSITGISHIKWAQGLQARRLQEAEETRRQQNEFIDITSHEMRNPLSAILQCADDITYSLTDYLIRGSDAPTVPIEIITSCIEAANTVLLCAQHQKCIVDDILTISKLGSNLLVITPQVVQPVAVAHRAVRMFDAEFQKKKIDVKLMVQESLQELQVDWALLDPSRLLQVLINLLTNAIKFTKDQPTRSINIRISALLEPPHDGSTGFDYIPPKSPKPNTEEFGEEWRVEELLFLQFEVQDTGRGLTPGEKKLLFMRFSQASPRTHAQYGGSGLGLFISRQLTELHGGQIGVRSEAGVGSTFAFYIKAKRARDPNSGLTAIASNDEPDWRRDSYVTQMLRTGDAATSHESRSLKSTVNTIKYPQYHILVVEDNLVNQKVLRKQLEKSGSIVTVTSHGGEALAYLEKTEFWKASSKNKEAPFKLSVILMDLEMPVMDGLTCIREIRALEKRGTISRRVPVVAVTANVRQQQVQAAKESGMDDVVSKPFRIPEVMAKIEGVLARLAPLPPG